MHNKKSLSTRHPPDIHPTFPYTNTMHCLCISPAVPCSYHQVSPGLHTKTQKTCLIFGYVKFLLYLCTRFREKVVMVYI